MTRNLNKSSRNKIVELLNEIEGNDGCRCEQSKIIKFLITKKYLVYKISS